MGLLESAFLKILNMSITGGYVIIAVLFTRLLLKKVPKVFSYALWSVATFRLLCPVSFATPISIFSLNFFDMTKAQSGGGQALTYIPSDIGLQQIPKLTIGIPMANSVISSSLPAATPMASVNPMQIWIFAAAVLWCIGIAAFLIYFLSAYIRVRNRIDGAVLLEKNIYECDKIQSPFVFGFLQPKIYIPFRMECDAYEKILAHEQYHIRRRDHIIKPFSFLLLAVYWFNPLVWVAFLMMCRDMEMSCDEKVLRSMDASGKKDYSMSLLSLASVRRFPAAGPLAFGESGVKARVKNILKFKKPGIWVILAALLLCAGVIIVCASNPDLTGKDTAVNQKTEEELYGLYVFDENLYTTPISSSFTPSKGRLLYFEIAADSLRVIDKEQGTTKEYTAVYEKKAVDENTFVVPFSDMAVPPDISQYKDCYQYAVFSSGDSLEYRLYIMDNEVWLASFSGKDSWLWSLYKIIRSEDSSIAEPN